MTFCGRVFHSVIGTADLVNLVKSYDLNLHLYADDTQIYWFSQTATTDELQSRVCVSAFLAVASISCQQSLW